MKKQTLEYNVAGKRSDVIGASDIAPGMLQKLKNHDIPAWMFDPIEVRVRKTGELLYTIPAHTAGVNECCDHCGSSR